MAEKVKTAPITGEVLEWALRDSGVGLAALADRLDVAEDEVQGWMYGDQEPAAKHLPTLSKVLGRPQSFFFLEEPPRRRPATVEFRRFAGSTGRPGSQTIEGVKLAQRVQKTQAWIRVRTDEKPIELPHLEAMEDVESAADKLREWLDWSLELQTGPEATDATAAKAFRAKLQDKGIIALNLTLDEGITRGFSLHEPHAPLVAANTRDPHRARLFSYAHELVHLCLGSDAVCGTRGRQRGIERFCNRVAAALLMPRRAFLELVRKRFGAGQLVADTKQVGSIRNFFRVSLRAAAIRAESLEVATPGLYALVDREAKADAKKRGGTYVPGNERTRPVIRVDQYGHQFINTLFSAERQGILRRRQLSEILSLSEKELSSIAQLSFAGVDA